MSAQNVEKPFVFKRKSPDNQRTTRGQPRHGFAGGEEQEQQSEDIWPTYSPSTGILSRSFASPARTHERNETISRLAVSKLTHPPNLQSSYNCPRNSKEFIGGWGGESAAAPTGKSFRFVRACERAGARARERSNRFRLSRWQRADDTVPSSSAPVVFLHFGT